MRRRLDVELVRRGLAPRRTSAAAAIAEGRVLVAGALAANAARQVAPDDAVTVQPAPASYVSRGGEKLAAGLDAFGVDVTGRIAVDVGASTGGFTDCLLQRGAAHVTAIDVGHGQLAWSLRSDPRVAVRERTNVRHLDGASLVPRAEVCVADVSFISLRTIAPALAAVTTADAAFVLLVKPQFEAGRAHVSRGGIVRDPAVHADVLRTVVDGLAQHGIGTLGVIRSPLRGADGNAEFLLHARKGPVRVDHERLERVTRDEDAA